jgi:hypothetical protein
MDQYKIRPHKLRRGWNLEGDRLSHGSLWYETESAAISYAKWNSRVNGCRVQLLNKRDEVVRVDEFAPADLAY